MMSLLSAFGGSEHDRYGIAHPRITSDGLAGLPEGMAVIVDDSGRPWFGKLPDWSAWCINERSELMKLKRERLPHITLTVGHIIEDKNPYEKDETDPDLEGLEEAIPEPSEEDIRWLRGLMTKMNININDFAEKLKEMEDR
jgi:hypothetical protein